VADWITSGSAGLLLLSGPVGSGKSSALSLASARCDQGGVARVDLRGLDADTAVERIFLSTGTDALAGLDTPVGEAIAALAPGLIIDSLDEMAQGDAQTTALLIRRLCQAGLRLVVSAAVEGDAGRLVPVLDPARHIRLDDPVRVALTAASIRSYLGRHLPDHAVGAAGYQAAFSAGGSFLLAHLWTHVPCALGQDLASAMAVFLASLPSREEARVRVMLAALSRGKGDYLPRPLWPRFARALSGEEFGEADVELVLGTCPWLIRCGGDPADPGYALAHQAYASYFRRATRSESAGSRVSSSLTRAVIDTAAQADITQGAVRYRDLHLAAHAADSGDLDEVLSHATHLVAVQPERLLRQLHQPAISARPLAQAYREVSSMLPGQPPPARLASILRAVPRDAAIARDRLCPAWTTVIDTVARTPRPVTYAGQAGRVWKVAVSSGQAGRLLASASSDGVVRLWETESGLVRAVCIGHSGPVSSVAFGRVAGEEVLASSGFDGTVRLWDPRDGAALGCLRGHTKGLWNVSFSEIGDRSVLVSSSADNTARLWDPQLGGCVSVLSGHDDWVWDATAAFAGGRFLVATASDDSTIRVWDALAGETLSVLRGHEGGVMGVRFTTVAGRTVLASAGQDGTLRTWDTERWHERSSRMAHADWIRGLDVLATGDRTLAATCGDDFMVRVWDLGCANRVAELSGHASNVSGVTLARSGQGVALWSGGFDHAINAWQLTGELPVTRPPRPAVQAVAAARDGDATLVAATAGHGLTIHSLPAKARRTREIALAAGDDATVVALVPVNGQPIAAIADGSARLQLVAIQGTVLDIWEAHTDVVSGLAAGADERGPLLASASYDRTVRIWRLPGRREYATLAGHDDWVAAVAFGRSGRQGFLASGSFDATVRVWDAVTGECLRVLEGHHAAVSSVAFGQAGGRSLVASGSFDATVRVWDAVTGECLRVLEGHHAAVSGVAFGQAGGQSFLASGSSDATVRIWTANPWFAPGGESRPSAIVIPALAQVRCIAVCERTVVAGTESGVLAVELGDWASPPGTNQAAAAGEVCHGAR
jgi:WD40 repeat protein